ncbi:MAG: response regulator [Helicobacter sp.]|nr:response regulator [Helicobacter sp.]
MQKATQLKNLFDLRLLYVEDDEQAQLVMQRILKRRFSDIVSAKDGQEALDVFLEGNVDIAIVDMNIPLLNGLELCMRIREKNEDMPIMMITAFDQSDCLLKALEIGVDRFLFKPINMEILDRQLKILARRAILFKQYLGVVV